MTDPISIADLKPTDLPAPPQEAVAIVRACSQQNISSKRLAEIVTHNAVLTAEILRIVNSAFFGFRVKVTSAAHAVTLLGQQALRNLALCVAMRDALRPEAIPGLDMAGYWEQALRRAVAARCLAPYGKLAPEECFTAGLLQDFGLLVMLYLQQDRIVDWPRLANAHPEQRYELELSLFGTTHDRVGGALAAAWQLPPELCEVMGRHHAADLERNNQAAGLCKVALCADWLAAIFTAVDKRSVVEQSRALLEANFGLSVEQFHGLLETLPQAVREAATALGMPVGRQIELADVLKEANLRLAEDNLSYQELTWRLEQALAERDRYADVLHRELELAREVQRSLMPRPTLDCQGFHGINTSANELSGDFYDYFPTHDGSILFCMADVSGKGMHAALLMAKVSSLFRCLGKGIVDPAALLAMLNREIYETSIRGMFVTMIGARLDRANGKVQLCNAGHVPALYLTQQGAVQELSAQAPPLGILSHIKLRTQEVDLRHAALYLYTDGLIEARQRDGIELGVEGLKKLIKRLQPLAPAQRATRILDALRDADVRDDMTLLMVDPEMASDGIRVTRTAHHDS